MLKLQDSVAIADHSRSFGDLVGSDHIREAPVHRWFSYKEGFSPALLGQVIDALGLQETGLKVVDSFGGVATTALAGLTHASIAEVRSVEYSPWARLVGATKLNWPHLEPARLRELLPVAVAYKHDRGLPLPELATFNNPRIFHHSTVTALLSAVRHLESLPGATRSEIDFFRLGLGAVIEDLSGAMKDGRALRIRGNRHRRSSSLKDCPSAVRVQGTVKRALSGQWTAMIEDLESLSAARELAKSTPAAHLAGDARDLGAVEMPDGTPAFPAEWADLACFSPPYLNCIDYSELYKLELWLVGFISNQQEFRELRLGTLRSHPSVKFPDRDTFAGVEDDGTIELILDISRWLTANSARRDVGPVVATYFEDMLTVWKQHFDLLAPNGTAVCVVANSTFSRRENVEGERVESWRLGLLTDVLLARLAKLAGFVDVEIWRARNLRARNVTAGTARESLVVVRKPPDCC